MAKKKKYYFITYQGVNDTGIQNHTIDEHPLKYQQKYDGVGAILFYKEITKAEYFMDDSDDYLEEEDL